MAHPILSDDEARTFFAALRDTTFDWTADRLPALMAELGWTIDTAVTIPGEAAIADVAWDLPEVAVDIQFSGSAVDAFYIPLASPADDPAAQLELADAFARFTVLIQDVLGAQGERVPGDYPGLRWRHGNFVLQLQGGPKVIFAFWATAEFQDTLDKMDTE